MQFYSGSIEGVTWRPLIKHHDTRGWLCELVRHDQIAEEFYPVMAYASVTQPGVARGPHEHTRQGEIFCFFGPSTFRIWLWDNRIGSPTYEAFQSEVVGEERPMALNIPAGVVHGYKNVGRVPGLVFNCANRLYRGWGRTEPADEVRHENDPACVFRLEENMTTIVRQPSELFVETTENGR